MTTDEQIVFQEQQGTIVAVPSPMSEAQYNYILELIDTCILADCQKDQIHESVENNNYTLDQGNEIINYLLSVQRNPLQRVQDGELLLQNDLKIAVRKQVENPNA
jgi:hypothetical protein